MILGRGTAQTDEAIIAEYHQFLDDTGHGRRTPDRLQDAKATAYVMQRYLGAPVAAWREEELLALFQRKSKATQQLYSVFLTFLIYRGYYTPGFRLLKALPLRLPERHPGALRPIRSRIEQTRRTLGYQDRHCCSELTLLILLLNQARKPLEELTRADFDAFRDEYHAWYRSMGRRKDGRPDNYLYRLEQYLIHWQVMPPVPVVYHHDVQCARIESPAFQDAIRAYVTWCEVKYRPSTIRGNRVAALEFVLWLQRQVPDCHRLDVVTRAIALTYARHLTDREAAGAFGPVYRNRLYQGARHFVDFLLAEQWETAPLRNPFMARDLPRLHDPVPRYLSDRELQRILDDCDQQATLKERTVVITLLHTGIRAAELATLTVSDIVQIQGVWKLHIREGKGLKDRMIPLTARCLEVLQAWQAHGWVRTSEALFSHHGHPWTDSGPVGHVIRSLGTRLGIQGLTPHRFRHTFAVALLNYGMRESALQKLMGHTTLDMTLEYARILDTTVEHAFTTAVEQMQVGPQSWVPSFFAQEDYTMFTEGDALSWIRLPHGYCRRNPKLHCESDVKCLLCDRFTAAPTDLPRFREMHARFVKLGLTIKAEVVAAQIRRLEMGSPVEMSHPMDGQNSEGFVPVENLALMVDHQG